MKINYAIEWKNCFGERVIYPQKTWKIKRFAEIFAVKLSYKRLIANNTIMRDIKIIEID